MPKIYISVLEGCDPSNWRVAFSHCDISDMDGEEMDEQCNFIDTFDGYPIRNFDAAARAVKRLKVTFEALGAEVLQVN